MPPQVPDLPPTRERPQLSVRASSHYSKAPSITPSNEADDEQSLSDLSFDMPDDPEPPQYAGQDTRLTSQKYVDPGACLNNLGKLTEITQGAQRVLYVRMGR